MSTKEGPFYVTNFSSGPPIPPYGTPERIRYDAAQAAAGLVGHPEPTPEPRLVKSLTGHDLGATVVITDYRGAIHTGMLFAVEHHVPPTRSIIRLGGWQEIYVSAEAEIEVSS